MEGGQRKSDVLSVAAYKMLPEKLLYFLKEVRVKQALFSQNTNV